MKVKSLAKGRMNESWMEMPRLCVNKYKATKSQCAFMIWAFTLNLWTSWSNVYCSMFYRQFERNLEWIGWKPTICRGNSTGILWVKNGKTTVRTSLGQRFAGLPKNLDGKCVFLSKFWLFFQAFFCCFPFTVTCLGPCTGRLLSRAWFFQHILGKRRVESVEGRGVCCSQKHSSAGFTVEQAVLDHWCPPVPPLKPHLINHHTWMLLHEQNWTTCHGLFASLAENMI